MRCMLPLLVLLGSVSLVGCERVAAPAPEAGDGRLEWRGISPCADCDGIDTVLVLQRQGDARSYRLAETYRVGGRDEPFVEAGQWRAEGALIRMQGEDGSRRVYAVLPDGRLQVRDGAGRRLPPGTGRHALEPVVARDGQ
ncbi:copper resistance protein NlpE N-terminal domain-containing protein [Luteimonas sp. R10]|uniref:copper resistance protein NlpE N-terminal domain-containing protein n=1 Tax=Luteimonas sp. R10 TaxID=3108176 RepID=UPI00308ACE8F|nr:copper resistance protein NlpE N-terminal domain-containing protein [Luteimonas sp. R10]